MDFSSILIADWVALGVAVLFAIIGLLVGCGKGLKFLTSGFLGSIIILAVTMLLYGVVIEIPIVQEWLGIAIGWLEGLNNPIINFLLSINLDTILVYVVLYFLTWLAKLIIVAILKSILEIDNGFFRVLNKLLGLALFVAFATLLVLITFAVADLVGGTFADFFVGENGCLTGSFFKLDWVYQNNPLNAIIASFTPVAPPATPPTV